MAVPIAAIMSILGNVGYLAVSMGYPIIQQKVLDLKEKKSHMSTDEILSATQDILKDAKSKLGSAYSSIERRIAKLPDASMFINGRVAADLNNVEEKMYAAKTKIEDKLNRISDLETRAQNLAYQPQSYRVTPIAKQQLQDIETKMMEVK